MILVTGANGQLGRCLTELLPLEHVKLTDVVATTEDNRTTDALDITDLEAVKAYVSDNNIDCIVNCAAYTAVDKAEDELELAQKINVEGPKNIALSGVQTVIHVSTDYVFDGTAYKPLTPNDKTNPISVYGKTKLEGEQQLLASAKGNAIIIRTSWLYSIYGNNFVKTMQRLGKERAELNVVADQVGTPTLANDLARAIVTIINKLQANQKQNNTTFIKEVYHYSNEGVCSWYDFAKAIMKLSNLPCKVNPIPTESYPTKATRPYYSVLDKSKIKNDFEIDVPHWLDSLEKIIK
ncbi:MAG: dTDP-4-dehydrorhamnose reductase [Ruminobacter sp.]|nr:dTDP-4-dehydrorhamnose reductase [Ruminobacter sp.]